MDLLLSRAMQIVRLDAQQAVYGRTPTGLPSRLLPDLADAHNTKLRMLGCYIWTLDSEVEPLRGSLKRGESFNRNRLNNTSKVFEVLLLRRLVASACRHRLPWLNRSNLSFLSSGRLLLLNNQPR